MEKKKIRRESVKALFFWENFFSFLFFFFQFGTFGHECRIQFSLELFSIFIFYFLLFCLIYLNSKFFYTENFYFKFLLFFCLKLNFLIFNRLRNQVFFFFYYYLTCDYSGNNPWVEISKRFRLGWLQFNEKHCSFVKY